MDGGRRNFLRGSAADAIAPQRPPWALAEEAFIEQCTRCNGCVEKCPGGIIVRGQGGFPQIDFARGACTFCAECAAACAPRALAKTARPWTLRAAISENCITHKGVVCRSCGDACEVRAIRFPPQRGSAGVPALDLESCNGCGACYAACPVSAVHMQVFEPAAQAA